MRGTFFLLQLLYFFSVLLADRIVDQLFYRMNLVDGFRFTVIADMYLEGIFIVLVKNINFI